MTDLEKLNAVTTNDRSYDGKFFYGVSSTGIFCRPSCPSKTPDAKNVVFFESAKEALEKGFRPCKRCHPELLHYDPVATLTAEARAAIEQSFSDRIALQERLNKLGVTRRHLTEVFELTYGLTPEQYIAQVRLNRAKELLAAGNKMTDTAFAVGMDSCSAFSTFFRKHIGLSPSEYVRQQALEHPYRFVQTAVGTLRIEENAEGICALQFVDTPGKAAGTGQSGESAGTGHSGRYLDAAEAQILEYFKGKRRSFDLPLSVNGSDFQKRVWKTLQDIPYGETRNYQQIASAVGNAKAARAVGMANNRNPLLIIIPCHRVVGKSGQLVGYAGGIERKQYLLDLETGRNDVEEH